METQYNYICPSCSQECVVAESLTGQMVVCPHCSLDFFATPPQPQEIPNRVVLPEKLPFFKSGRRKILQEKFTELIADGAFDDDDEKLLNETSALLGLDKTELGKIRREHSLKEFEPIKRSVESTLMLSDDHLAAIQRIEGKYGIRLTLEGYNNLYRAIYMVECRGRLPQPMETGLMLNPGEQAYYSILTTWHQTRVRRHGYSGTSVSLPTGIKGVRFRFGDYTPIRSEEMTPLSPGTLYVTSERLVFNGDTRNTAITLKRIVDVQVFSDALRVDKNTGKPDLFSMAAPEARYITALIGALK
jgi:DNA-directed RNA polymerase subunit RPC12/RpoP